jgi:diguanylate cyclase (GGDEF)-like protein/PAS domain S-box-containing protein
MTDETTTTRTRLPDQLVPKVLLGNAETLQKIIDVIPSPVFVKDAVHRWVLVNDALTMFQNAPREAILGKTDFDLMPREQAELFWRGDEDILATGASREYEVKVNAGGIERYIVTRKSRLSVEGTHYLVGVINDVTQYRQAEARSRFLSLHDGLTGLPNRSNFYQSLEELVIGEGEVTVMLIDLDGFKAVNDQHGHAAGDELLHAVAGRLRHGVRAGDLVARLGGDEFAIIIKNAAGREAISRVAHDLCVSLAKPIHVSAGDVQISASIGITSRQGAGVKAEELVRQADVAMYRVKHGGRAGYQWFE